MPVLPSCQVTQKNYWCSNTKSDYGGSGRHESVMSVRSVNNVSKRNMRCASGSYAKCTRLASEQSRRSERLRRLMSKGIARGGSGLHLRRCTGER